MKFRISILSTCFLFSLSLLSAQKLEPNDRFSSLLGHCEVEWLKPLDAGYKSTRVLKNRLLRYDYAIRSRKEKLEIRYLLEPHQENNPTFNVPHLRCMQKVMSLATNEQDLVMTGLDIDEKTLQDDFNADWGKIFFFTPKGEFSTYKHLKMLALFKEGRGMAYVFFLFDKPNRDLDNRLIALRFKEQQLLNQ